MDNIESQTLLMLREIRDDVKTIKADVSNIQRRLTGLSVNLAKSELKLQRLTFA